MTIAKPKPEDFAAQMPTLRALADLRDDRLPEVLVQMHDILSFFGSIHQLDESQRHWTLELLEAAVRLAVAVEMPIKHGFRAPRPNLFAPAVMPLIQTPPHGSYPSGHACESFFVATVLHRLSATGPTEAAVRSKDLLFRQAYRLAENRSVAGVHFPHDSLAGALLGCCLGDWLADSATGEKLQEGAHYDDSIPNIWKTGNNPNVNPFTLGNLADLLAKRSLKKKADPMPVLSEVWQRAKGEW